MRIASVPGGHPYVRGLSVPGDGVTRLPDPRVPGAPSTQWWPPAMLEPSWLRTHAAEFDVVHVHFGYDDRTPAQLRALVETLRAIGAPLVVTVHDLRNPHHRDPAPHAAALDVLIPAADALLTLTSGAAAAIRARWGRESTVVPHPQVVPDQRIGAARPTHAGVVVGLHAKSVRANADPVPVARALADVIATLPGVTLRIDAHDDERGRTVAADLPDLDVHVHRPFSDDELWYYLSGLDVSVLPYRFGTHSGWLEACHDLGTAVVAPDCGFYDQQAPCRLYRHNETHLDTESLATAVRSACSAGPAPRADPALRAAQRAEIAAVHAAVYRTVLARAAAA